MDVAGAEHVIRSARTFPRLEIQRPQIVFTFARNDLLFTMSDNTRTRTLLGWSAIAYANLFFLTDEQSMASPLVEPDGIEPTTSCLQSRRSPN